MNKEFFLFLIILLNNNTFCFQNKYEPSFDYKKIILRKIINELIHEKQDLDKEYTFGKYTNFPLKQAIEFDDEESVTLLIKNGANVNLKINEEGDTLLHIAASGENLAIIKLLIEAGIDINAKGGGGDTALIHAITAPNNLTAIINFLLEKGADLNIKNDEGDTALIVAIEVCTYGNNRIHMQQIIKALIFHGANLDVTNIDGKNIMEIAEKKELEEMIEDIVKEYKKYTVTLDVWYV